MTKITRAQFMAGAGGALLGLGAGPASAQAFPNRQIRMLIGFAPGGIIDFIGRAVAQGMGEVAGQSIVVENRAGASGIVATEALAKSVPDGYTILASESSISVNPAINASLPYDSLRDLRAVAIVSSSPLAAVVPVSMPVRTLRELAEHGQRNRGQLNFVSPGTGTMTHLAGEIFSQVANMDASPVVYRGVGASFPDLIAGRVQFVWSGIPGVLPLIENGQLRPLATSGETRAASLPNVPTAREAGFPDLVIDLWAGIFVPAATPDAVVQRMNAILQDALRRPDTAAALARAGATPRFTTPTEAQDFFRLELARWAAHHRGRSAG
jgi:tripartite-type tricarboxylate transporter receptor subunit TctC